jgi:hypothetical protein
MSPSDAIAIRRMREEDIDAIVETFLVRLYPQLGFVPGAYGLTANGRELLLVKQLPDE